MTGHDPKRAPERIRNIAASAMALTARLTGRMNAAFAGNGLPRAENSRGGRVLLLARAPEISLVCFQ
ncbi:hypothetical protein GCM10007928_06330 [Sulfitobacter porphyrae]|nr:hypothetical protein GCM10007928_06330 [Sulfitobacter porphyrae]